MKPGVTESGWLTIDVQMEHIENVQEGEIASGMTVAAPLDLLQHFFAILDRFPLQLGFA